MKRKTNEKSSHLQKIRSKKKPGPKKKSVKKHKPKKTCQKTALLIHWGTMLRIIHVCVASTGFFTLWTALNDSNISIHFVHYSRCIQSIGLVLAVIVTLIFVAFALSHSISMRTALKIELNARFKRNIPLDFYPTNNIKCTSDIDS